MSSYYDIKEHLIVKDRQPSEFITPKDDIVDIMHYQLSLLGALMLQEIAYVDELTLNADGKTYAFSGRDVTPEFGELMRALNTARNLELTMHYDFTTYGMNGVSQSAGPRTMMQWFDELKDEEMDGIFYCAWCKVDCNGDAGNLYAYGNHDGTFHRGEITAKSVSAYPVGKWYADTDVVVDMDGLSPEQVQRIIAICRELNQLTEFPEDGQQLSISCIPMSYGNPIDFSEDGVSYYMNDACLKTPEDIARLLSLYAELSEVTDGGCGCIGEYVDLSTPNARLMHIDHNAEGLARIKVTAV
jgi:hypothetical protein